MAELLSYIWRGGGLGITSESVFSPEEPVDPRSIFSTNGLTRKELQVPAVSWQHQWPVRITPTSENHPQPLWRLSSACREDKTCECNSHVSHSLSLSLPAKRKDLQIPGCGGSCWHVEKEREKEKGRNERDACCEYLCLLLLMFCFFSIILLIY